MGRTYSANLSKTQGRTGYSIIFRHPCLEDRATGKPGRRIRRGLGTRDEKEARELCADLNEILSDPKLHDAGARESAAARFDSRVVEIFYSGLSHEPLDFEALRERFVRLPSSSDSAYRRALCIGTTGAGKTTLVRQLIGTDPVTERFPSISTAKTTIHDTEIVLADGPWRAVVTFVSSDEVRDHLFECVSAAVVTAAAGKSDEDVVRSLLAHVGQRFRFNYVLGNGPWSSENADEEDDEDLDPGEETAPALEEDQAIDLRRTNQILAAAVDRARDIAHRHVEALKDELEARDDSDERVIEEIMQEEIDRLLREDETVHEIVDSLIDEIEKRFDLLTNGEVERSRSGWPLAWSWETSDRGQMLRNLTRFSSNYAPYFGRLLTPLVNGVRIQGPFQPPWPGERPALVLLDGEGLGHTPKSSAALPTSLTRRIDKVDAVLLIDHAAQPMQAAPAAAIRELVSSGNVRKLIFVFTHFDQVTGDNLPSVNARSRHVLDSVDNVLASVGVDLSPAAERALRQRMDRATFFLGGIQERLNPNKKKGQRSIAEIKRLLSAIDEVIERPDLTEARPIYDRMNLVLAVKAAAEGFHSAWDPRLGLRYDPGLPKEHWTRVKALSRRLAAGWADEYDSLRPVADLRRQLTEKVYVFLQSPLGWEGPEPTDEEKQEVYDRLADDIQRRMLELATRRVWHERELQWRDAYDKSGTGSTFVRARIIGEQIYESAAPVPDAVPSPDKNSFLHEVSREIDQAAARNGAKLV